MSDYNLQFQSPVDNFSSQTVLSDLNNRRTLQAALTSLIQADSTIAGSIVEINTPVTTSSRRKRRRQSSSLSSISFELNVISSKTCTSTMCLNQFQTRAINSLTSIHQVLSGIRYQQPNTTTIYWLDYKLPRAVKASKIVLNCMRRF